MKKFIEREPAKCEYPRTVFTNLDEFERHLESAKGYVGAKIYNTDLSQLDLSSQRGKELLSKINGFDEKTIWPENLSEIKEKQIESGKNSGLGIKGLHKKSYTGKGVNIAIIDQVLLVNHPEYQENVKYYKEMGNEDGQLRPGCFRCSYHGPAVSSLAVGKNCGSAPDAGLYFVSDGNCSNNELSLQAIKHLISLNKGLDEKNKIRCLSCSWGGGPKEADFEERMKLFKEMEETGCMVFGGFYSHKIGRYYAGGSKIQQDSEAMDNLKLDAVAAKHIPDGMENVVIVPEHQRTIASPSGGYFYEEIGGASWCPPYLAGLVACAIQANPDFVKQKGWQDKIWEKLLQTAKPTPNRKGKIVQPEAFVKSVIGGKEKGLKKALQKAQVDGKSMLQDNAKKISLPSLDRKTALLSNRVQH